ncbi:hypothetical protein TCAL_06839 [Tigriopus californicus]|uniref:Uncharacterized protein n=1 Tax=Tigriopus californicus TaxID=6832 RepID=A0A553NUI6_TIGCA|nr:uncharacterized protein LOC131893638 [Tigriopus californicus]TRY69080.1 hypothetical protein TCAL_06839 [Tigriopus californicus]|eukprot:TCALIF_06839-PA protein Name:"Similar to Smyd4 SET and MYND domain-containing protein 4 (Mus musculus)" AED:0.30 eAED:0.30 QI:50/1/0.5/1/1/0.5/2/0/647
MRSKPYFFEENSPTQSVLLTTLSSGNLKKLEEFNNSELVDFFLSQGTIPDCSEISLQPTLKQDLSVAKSLKDEGNRLFKEGRHLEAREKYTASICAYPVDWSNPSSNTEFAITLANRSATMDAAGSYEACVNDIDMALKYGYPKNLQYKVFKRKGHALLRLKQYIQSRSAYAKSLDMIGKSDLPSKARDELRARTKKNMGIFTVAKSIQDNPIALPLPLILDQPPSENKNAGVYDLDVLSTPCLQQIDEHRTNVTRDISLGSCLFKESPRLAILLSGVPGLPQLCPHTLKPLVAPIPCSFGGKTLFANEKAREEANASYNRYEWPLDPDYLRQSLGLSPYARLALRMVLSVDPKDLVSRGWEEAMAPKFGMVLESDATVLSAKQRCERGILTAVLLKILRNIKYSEGPQESETNLVSCLWRCIHYVDSFAFPLRHTKMEKASDPKAPNPMTFKTYGLGLFPGYRKLLKSAQKLKPEDDSNAFVTFTLNRLLVITYRIINEGEALVLVNDEEEPNEVPPGEEMKTRKEPNDMIVFKCSNPACSATFPLKENTKEKVIRCPVGKCQKDTNIWLKLTKIQELKQKWRALQGSLSTMKPCDQIKAIEDLLKEWQLIVARPYQDIDDLELHVKRAVQTERWHAEQNWLKEYL